MIPTGIKPRIRAFLPGGMPRIDWSNPITNGLVACYVPGAFGFGPIKNICGSGNDLVAGTGATFNATAEGVGVSAFSAPGGATGLAAASMQLANQGSYYYRGSFAGLPSLAAVLIGITNNNTNSSPHYGLAFQCINNGTQGQTIWNTGGTEQTLYENIAFVTGQIFGWGTTFVVGGNVITYFNGAPHGSISFGASPASYTATSYVDLNADVQSPGNITNATCLVGMYWNRVLNPAEMLSVNEDPYQFLIFPYDDLFAEIVGSAVTQYLKSVALTLGETVATTQFRTRVKTNAFTLGETVATTRIRKRVKTSAITLTQTFKRATAAVSATKLITLAQTFKRATAAVSATKTVSLGQSFNAAKQYSGVTSAVVLLLGQTLTAGTKVFHGVITSLVLLQSVQAMKQAGKTVSVQLAQTVGALKQIARIVAVLLGQSVSVLKSANKTVSAVLGETLAAARQTFHGISAAFSLTENVSVGKRAARAISLLSAQLLATSQAVHSAGTNVAFSLGQTLTATKRSARTIAFTLGEIFVSAQKKAKNQAATLSLGETVNTTRSAIKSVSLSVAQTLSALKAPVRKVAVQVAQILSAAKQASHRATTSLGQTAVAVAGRQRAVQVQAVLTNTLSAARGVAKTAALSLTSLFTVSAQAPQNVVMVQISQGQTFAVAGRQFLKVIQAVQNFVLSIVTFRTPGPQSTAVQVNFTIEPTPAPPVPPTPPPQPGGVFVSFD